MAGMTPSTPIRREPASEEREWISARSFGVAGLCLLAAVFAVYWPALQFQFILDEHRFTADPRIQFSGYIWDYFTTYVWAQFTGGPPSFYRPVFLLWLRINFIVNALSPWGWHLLSIAKHAVAAALLGWLAWKLLRDRVAALLAATLFALHPAQTESVAWVTVPDPLMAIGVLGALLFYLKYRESITVDESRPGGRSRKGQQKRASRPKVIWLVASVIACFAGELAKETAVIFPVLILGVVLVMSRDAVTPSEEPRRSQRFRCALGQVLPFLVVTGVALLFRMNALGRKLAPATQHLPWTTVVLSSPGILWFYVKALIWPVRSYAFADPLVADGLSFRGVVLPAIGIVVFGGALAWMRAGARKTARGTGSDQEEKGVESALMLGALLLILPLLLTLNLNTLNPGDFLHGRYVYLPSAGLMLLIATGWHMAGKLRLASLASMAVVAVVLAVLTVSQEKQWRDDLTLFTVAHELAPHNEPVARNLANARVQAALQLDQEGRCSEAIPVFEQVTRQYPEDWYAWAALADCQVQMKDLPKAEESLHRAADLSHEPRILQQWQELRATMGLPRANSEQ